MTKQEILHKLRTTWTRVFSDAIDEVAFLRRKISESSTSTLSSSLNDMDSTVQHHWSARTPDLCATQSTPRNSVTLCDRCLQPSESVRPTSMSNFNRERQCSQPVRVPDSLATAFRDHEPQANRLDSLGYESGFGNELSPTTTSWTLGFSGVTDTSSRLSSTTSDEISTDPDPSESDDLSNTYGPGDEGEADEDLEEYIYTPSVGNDDDDEDSFEVLSFEAPPESTIYIKEFPCTTPESQNHRCHCCDAQFTTNHRPRRCYYYGKYYCARCHILDKAHIPAKMIKSFDMRLYPVCRRAKLILQLNIHQPLIDIPADNDHLYIRAPILNEIKIFRLQFQYFYAYLSTCARLGADFQEKFFKQFYARDYLYQSVHLYSISDFLSLKKVLQMLQQTSQRAKEHIHSCPICREKGFTCEVCKKRQDILYPFDDSKTIRQCPACSNIYHKKCWENIDGDCPKCYRLIQRRKTLCH